MNDTGGGVTAIHDVPGDITRIGFHWMLLFFLSVTRRGASIFSSHGVSRRSRGVFVPNLRICEFFLHTENRGDYGFSLSRDLSFDPLTAGRYFSNCFLHTDCRGIIFFVTNYRIIEYLSHGMSRRSRIFFVPRLVLGPTDRREVICELFLHTKCRGWLWGLLFMRMGAIRRCL